MNKIIVISTLLLFSFFVQSQELNKIQYYNQQKLTFFSDGMVDEINVTNGDLVKKGQILATLDQTIEQLQVKKSQANLDAVEVVLNESNEEYERTLELFDRGVLTEIDLLKALRHFKIQQAIMVEAQAALAIVKKRLQNQKLIALDDGMIINNNLYPGKLVRNQLQLTSFIEMVSLGKVQFFIKNQRKIKKVDIGGTKLPVRYKNTLYNSSGAVDRYIIKTNNAYQLIAKKVKIIK